ncbi:MAG: PilZ domain-containing protein [Candidatus Omnitrophica bacterium]|nr:PilZ domain-containing protein [Candidatus Omnitrophota bacterium]
MDKGITEKRQFPRVNVTFPIRITPEFLGETVDLSQGGLGFALEKPLLLSKVHAKIELSPEESIDTELKIIWNKRLIKEGRFTYGACFVRLGEKDLEMLGKVLIKLYADSTLDKFDDAKIKEKIWSFWNKDFKEYLDKLIKLSNALDNREIDIEKGLKVVADISDIILRKGDELEVYLNDKIVTKKIKRVFRELCGPWVYRSKIVKHAFEKPRGYPGDYQLLEIIYDDKPISDYIGYCYDRYFLNNAYAVGVRNRKDKMRDILNNFINSSDDAVINILNVACGSCREIKELIIDKKLSSFKKINFNLVDQDEKALEFCKGFLKDNQTFSYKFLPHNIREYIKDSNKYRAILGKQNLIYSICLADYLPDRVLINLLLFCYSLLVPQGKLIIAHKDIKRYKPLAPDWACDWTFYPRDQEYLVRMINESGIKGFDLKIERDFSGVILFLTLTKA